jgi:hypothetical protein
LYILSNCSIFLQLKMDELLFRDNEEQIHALHMIFGPLIQHALTTFVSSWNHHSIKKVGVPHLLYEANKQEFPPAREPLSVER